MVVDTEGRLSRCYVLFSVVISDGVLLMYVKTKILSWQRWTNTLPDHFAKNGPAARALIRVTVVQKIILLKKYFEFFNFRHSFNYIFVNFCRRREEHVNQKW